MKRFGIKLGQFQDETGGRSMAQWIYGKNAAMQILKSKKKIEKALVAEGTKFPEAEALLKSRRIPVYFPALFKQIFKKPGRTPGRSLI